MGATLAVATAAVVNNLPYKCVVTEDMVQSLCHYNGTLFIVLKEKIQNEVGEHKLYLFGYPRERFRVKSIPYDKSHIGDGYTLKSYIARFNHSLGVKNFNVGIRCNNKGFVIKTKLRQ